MIYGIYSVLFFQSCRVLCTQRRPHYKFHLGCMISLFLLSTIHIALAYTWAFITDGAGSTAIYELFSLRNPLPVLYSPDDPIAVHRLGIILKARYSLANAIADAIMIYRCYVIYSFKWRPVAFLIFAYGCMLVGAILGLLPLSGTAERAAAAVCILTVFLTNVLATALAAWRIWWISRQAANFLGGNSRKKYMDLPAILLESGLIYPTVLFMGIILFLSPPPVPTVMVLICIAASYHLAGIAPTLIIVRVGLGVSTDDVEKSVLVSRGAGMHPDIENQRGADPPMELQARTKKYSEEFPESSNKTQTF
ncbi:hypothetical protein K438DRAFT_819354 [Mycena galopus ATCC 62051]|nr:hypothetical protein K438DRAFT_819354 [Mycena galopus ATCC 62051]